MKLRTLATLLAMFVGLGIEARSAQAAPVFLLPDINFAAVENGRPVTALNGPCPTSFAGTGFGMSINGGGGDMISMDSGTGFKPLSGFVVDLFSEKPGLTELFYGPNFQANGGVSTDFRFVPTLVGVDGFGVFRITSNSTGPFKVGELVGVDLHVFNLHSEVVNGRTILCGDVKGDVAPVVPEPASVSLVLLGLGALGAARRRR